MKVLHSDAWVTVYLACCPACDLPLEFAESTRTDGPSSWLRGETVCDDHNCPRCGAPLPVERRPVAA